MFRKYMQEVSKDQIIDAFGELLEMQDTGILCSNGVVRGLIGVYRDYYPTCDTSIGIIEKEIYYEMAMRFYADNCE